ncbi:DoxX family protein [Rhizobium leguminosarum]|uniref:DoxX family protein n=1 Tax=Rhizobium leguminosarum TaxID=384 RepID=UPI0005190853|nr:DoxX family protein [Rhizobium leguminosarum]NKL10289.1 DoxX family protein [Rhizobium leguminosarum bv. viciae]NKL88054.1 DoxX family protein [Rhizobium leguminosarum bv. viciae]NKL95374.1 DoxX family protein [Rhizobium leguminosarum bv. viciae]NKM96415.1 DoxX family protein [Rhizobium leguminosarum bv. viciae]
MLMRKYAYWISTGLISLLYLASATFYITQGDTVRQLLGALGYPAYLVPFLITVKLLGVAAILSRVNVALSDLAYSGMFFHLLLALSAHLAAADYAGAPPAVVGLVALAVSFLTQNAARAKDSPYALPRA